MATFSKEFKISTKGYCDIHDLSKAVQGVIKESKIINGIVTVFVPGSTASVTTLEPNANVGIDLEKALEKIAPKTGNYAHEEKWHDGNGFSHVRSALMKTSQTFPLNEGEIPLGAWQQIVLVDFDNKKRERSVIVHVVGE